MAWQVCLHICIAFGAFYGAAGLLHMDVSPTELSPGLTESLTVSCNFSYAGLSNISSIISLIMSKSNDINNNQPPPPPPPQPISTTAATTLTNNKQFIELESLNVFNPDHVIGLSQINASVTGQIDASGDSYLSIHWSYPTSDNSGLYKCDVHGVDSTGHPIKISKSLSVKSHQPDLNQLIDKVSDLQRQLDHQENLTDHLNSQLDRQENITARQESITKQQSDSIDSLLSLTQNQSNMISLLQSQLKSQSEAIITLQEEQEDHKFMSRIIDNVFQSYTQRGGTWYLLSKDDTHNADHAAAICEAYGGYLVEIDDAEEHQFIKAFLDNVAAGTNVPYVLVSGSDQQQEGTWKYAYHQTELQYADWYPGEAETPAFDCILMYQKNQWQFHFTPCVIDWNSHKFLCELDMQ